MTVYRLLLAFMVLFAALGTELRASAAEPTRKPFAAWAAECTAGDDGYCTAGTRIKAPNLSYRFQLRVSRAAGQADFEIALLTGREHPAPGTTITVNVDSKSSLSLTPEHGYRRAGRSHSYVVSSEAAPALLEQMRTGRRVQFRYTDAGGQDVVAEFPLAGFAGALGFMRKMQPAVREPRETAQLREEPTRVAAAPRAEPAAQPQPEVAATTPAETPKTTPTQPSKATVATAAPSRGRKRGARSIRQFSCRGNEPFWSFSVDNNTAHFTTLTDSGQRDLAELTGKLSVTGDGPTPVIDWRGKSDWGASFRAVITEQQCKDSMADAEGQTEFDYRVELTLPGGKRARGCCSEGLEPVAKAEPLDLTQFPVANLSAKPETDWSRFLLDLLPAIQACLSRTPEPDAIATKAWPMSRGMVGVRTRNRSGGWFECAADSEGRRIERFAPLPPGSQRAPNEDRAVFSPSDQAPPPGNCYNHERVMDGMGDFRGWLSTNRC